MLQSDLQHAARERAQNTQCYTLEMHMYKSEFNEVVGDKKPGPTTLFCQSGTANM